MAETTTNPPENGDQNEQKPEVLKLPLPDIEATLKRYLDAVETFTPPDQFESTKKHVEEFKADSEKMAAIQKFLEERFNTEENWAYRWWLEDMYLNNMLPLPVNSNPGWVFPRKEFNKSTDEMIKYASKLVVGLCNFKQQLEKGELPEELAPGRSGGPKLKLCMKQYERLLNAYRVPGEGQDDLVCSDAIEPRNDEHVIVMAYGHMFKMNVKREGTWMTLKQIKNQLTRIETEAGDKDVKLWNERPSLLTSETRNVWNKNRKLLLDEEGNEAVLKEIESCLFLVCIDPVVQNETDTSISQKDMFKLMLTGMGAKFNGSNRWFDKTVQLVVSRDGVNGMCYEHTASEGVAVVIAMLNIFKEIESMPDVDNEDDSADNAEDQIQALDWTLTNEELKVAITEAAKNLDKLSEDTDDEVFKFVGFGKSFIKTCNCSPDAFLQMSLQLAYYRVHGTLCPTYESASTRRFAHGRVDSIRASHPEALAWTQSMLDGSKSKDEKKELFKEAIVKQTKIMKENIFGEGVDIPLLGLRRASEALWPDDPLPLFQDPTYAYCNLFKLSTSQVPINLPDSYMGYGAVVPDGYGVSYNLQNEDIIFAICSFFSCESTCSRRFAKAVQQSLEEMRELFQA